MYARRLVAMTVMQIGAVFMAVLHRRMHVLVAMPSKPINVAVMLMIMMTIIVLVPMGMSHREVTMSVFMLLALP